MRCAFPLVCLSLLAAAPAAVARPLVVPRAHRPAHAAGANLSKVKLPGLDTGSASLTGDADLAGLGLDDGSGKKHKGADPYGLSTDTSGLKSDDASATTTSRGHRGGGGGGGHSAGASAGGSSHASGRGSSTGSKKPHKARQPRH